MAYHVTPLVNLPAIEREGLVPRLGGRAAEFGEAAAAIWLFPGMDDLQSACESWIVEAFDEEETLALLWVEIPADARTSSSVGFEIEVSDPIAPHHLRVLSLDLLGETMATLEVMRDAKDRPLLQAMVEAHDVPDDGPC